MKRFVIEVKEVKVGVYSEEKSEKYSVAKVDVVGDRAQ